MCVLPFAITVRVGNHIYYIIVIKMILNCLKFFFSLTFTGPCIVICSYNKSRDALISQIYFGIEFYVFRTNV